MPIRRSFLVAATAVLFVTAARPADTTAPGPRAAVIKPDVWKSAPTTPATPAEIDALVLAGLKAVNVTPAPRTTDEQFLRRATLDLTGMLPTPGQVAAFTADTDLKKREKLVDRLLASEDYARHGARYWRDVIAAKLADRRGQALARPFEIWLTRQLSENTSWADITRALLTASGTCHFDDDGTNGALFFLLSKSGADGANERAAETARVFLGLQIQCAQCHDHPSDVWKRPQFHAFAGYFARCSERRIQDGQRQIGLRLGERFTGEHLMPSKDDPKKGTFTPPRFLDGSAPPPGLADADRRRALADAVVAKDNPWFAAAYVNRLWGELMGQSFYTPVDDMGPEKEAVFGALLARLAGAFRGTDYDMKAFFRTVLATETYQRQTRLGDSTGEHLQFAASYPKRLSAESLWQALTGVLGPFNLPGPAGRRPPMAAGPLGPPRLGLEPQFKEEFRFDPSLKADEVEDSIPQALLLMNNPQIQQKIQARPASVLGRLLDGHPDDGDALRAVYLRTLARKPTDREKEKCLTYIAKVGKRAEAFEDILWALLNATEFQTKR